MVFHHLPPPPPEHEPLPPLSPPPSPPPPPPRQLPPRAFSTSFPIRWALGNRNRNPKPPSRRFRSFGRLPLPTTGGVNPVLRLGSSPLNPGRPNPFLNIDEPDSPNHDDDRFGSSNSPPPKERNLSELVQVLEDKTEDKATPNNLLVRLPVKKRNLSALCAEPEPEPEPKSQPEPEDKAVAEIEEGEVLEYDDGMIHKTWNLRPRRVLQKKNHAARVRNNGGGGGGWLGHVSSRTRTRLRQQKEKGNNKSSGSGGIKGLNNNNKDNNSGGTRKEKEKEGVVLHKGMLSLTLKKEEIEEDFLKMTGAKPPKKPINKRSKAVQKQLDIIFPGLWLTTVTPESYKVPDPPLKRKYSRVDVTQGWMLQMLHVLRICHWNRVHYEMIKYVLDLNGQESRRCTAYQ
ncbi:hypothetical protein PIB30_078251 [Stylosanthes scabra]|uniref:Uncharacterized protein n=1 Tax=Stylosanthes scabra TaxID=79078 RepID=A0ABU6WU86_9FABA|nr:hypothetical protein [Stylosanthes scabra]